jgi:hypothetical protein
MRGNGWIFLGVVLAMSFYQLIFRYEESSISPTAHYTSYIWVKHNLSPIHLRTPTGILLFYILEPLMMISRTMNGPTIENMLMARHQMIDTKLCDLIEKGMVTQVIEIASGLSGRGKRIVEKYDNVTYYETDFEKMIFLKQKLISSSRNDLNPNHKFFTLNALKDSEVDSLKKLFDNHLQVDQGIVVITEGLLPYFTQEETLRFWSLLSTELSRSFLGVYLSDFHLKEDLQDDQFSQSFIRLLSFFVQKRVSSYELSKQQLFQTFHDLTGVTQITLSSTIEYSEKFPEIMGAKGSDRVRLLAVEYQRSALRI